MAQISVQFIGKEMVLKAFEKKDFSKWALCHANGKFITTYEGDDDTESRQELDDWLKMLRSNTTAIFILKFYEKSIKTIRQESPESGSFNFRLAEEEKYQSRSMAGIDGLDLYFKRMDERMDALDKKITGIKVPEADPDKLETWERMLENPVIMAGIGKLFNLDLQGLIAESAKMNGVPDSLDDTIEGLRKHDPKIEEHLHKLLTIAVKSPSGFRTLLTMLEGMKV